MKFSESPYAGSIDLWKEAAAKPFVQEMAKGTLSEELFRNYMIQDYLYLLEYIDILRDILEQTGREDLRNFLQKVLEETENETYRVHLPHMKKAGVSDEEIEAAVMTPVIPEYIGFMRSQVRERGCLAGLTALLQCSWLYAYIGERMISGYPEEIAASPYKFWFDAYICRDYIDANQMWIDLLDREAEGISSEMATVYKNIFRACAVYENRLWDELHQRQKPDPEEDR